MVSGKHTSHTAKSLEQLHQRCEAPWPCHGADLATGFHASIAAWATSSCGEQGPQAHASRDLLGCGHLPKITPTPGGFNTGIQAR